jgi:hypothetical protein
MQVKECSVKRAVQLIKEEKKFMKNFKYFEKSIFSQLEQKKIEQSNSKTICGT